jgi:ABC-type oligopeptide transport system ATPase subunit
MSHLLEVTNLKTQFPTRAGLVRAVDDVSFQIDRGELLGLVGESGCGKSMTALSIMRLIAPPGKIIAGEILFEGRNLLKLSNREMRNVRGNDIAMIFQDPMTSPQFRFSPWANRLPKRFACIATCLAKTLARLRSPRCAKSRFPIRKCAPAIIRINFPGACVSA